MFRAAHRFIHTHSLVGAVCAQLLVACVGSGSEAGSGGTGGSGVGGGGFGAIGGVGGIGFDGGCIECVPGCFDCVNSGCNVCGTGGVGGDNDGGVITQPWTSPFMPMGEPGGWRSAGDASLCMGGYGFNAMRVWSDERGVFVLGDGQFGESVFRDDKARTRVPSRKTQDSAGAAPPPPFDAGFGGVGGGAGVGGSDLDGGGFGACFTGAGECPGYAVYFHDGSTSGWRRYHASPKTTWDSSMRALAGMPASDLIVTHANPTSPVDCTLAMLDGTDERCLNMNLPIAAAFGVDAQLAFAVAGTTLLVYDGTTWSAHPAPIPFTPTAMWATATDVVVVGDVGRIARLRDGVWTTTNRTIELLTSVWAGEGETLWIGTAGGQVLHRDAEGNWQEPLSLGGVSCATRDAVAGIWGSGDTVYFHSARALAQWDGTRMRMLSNWTCALSDPFTGRVPPRITGMWGNAPNELFVSVTDNRSWSSWFDECGDGFVVYFDGQTFHRL